MRDNQQEALKQNNSRSSDKLVRMNSHFESEKRNFSIMKIVAKKIASIFFPLIASLACTSLCAQSQYIVNTNTITIPPTNAIISQYISSGNVRCSFTSTSPNYLFAYAQGKIECLSPKPFSITMNSNFRFNQGLRVSMSTGVPTQLTVAQMLAAFGNFNQDFLQVQGINIDEIKDGNNNIKLPEGVYRICFAARNIGGNMEPTDYFSDPNTGCATFTIAPAQPPNAIIINTRATPPVNPFIEKAVQIGGVNATLQFNNPTGSQTQVKLFGKIEALSPNPFTISLNPSYNLQQAINLAPGVPVQLTANQIADAFGNFQDNNLVTSGIDLASLRDVNNSLKLPDGVYKICLYARYFANGVLGANASNPDIGCATFNLCSKTSAPQFTQPASNFTISSNINIIMPRTPMIFTWTPPNSACGATISAVTYDFQIRELFASQTITDAINNPPVFSKTLLPSSTFILDTNLYKGVLQTGHQYVIRVRANPAANSSVQIENDGYSRVEAFQYGEVKTQQISAVIDLNKELPISPQKEPVPVIPNVNNMTTSSFKSATCTCVSDISTQNQSNNNASLSAGGSFKMASLTIKIASIRHNGNTVSGDGTVLINEVPVMISFANVIVNNNGIAIDGTATGRTANGFDFLKNAESPSISTTNFNSFLNQIKNYNLDAVKNAIGIPIPFGLNSVGAPDEVNVGVVALNITPQQASYNAIAVVQLADANNVLSLLAKDVCFTNTSIMCGDALFALGADFKVPSINLTFKSYQSDANPGTHVLYSDKMMKKFQIDAEYNFPATQLSRLDGGEAKATLKAEAISWSDWTATVTMDPFKTKGLDNVIFTLKSDAFYDHSTTRNPAGMPSALNDPALSEKNAEIGNPIWTGFFLPSVSVALPALIKDLKRPDNKLEISATNLIIDQSGLTGIVSANNIVSLDDGSLGGWYCSLDNISIKFLNSSYKEGGLYGKLLLPFSDKNKSQSQIDYSCTLSSSAGEGGLTYQFIAKQKNDLDFSAWWANINIHNFSIEVSNNNTTNETIASANLSGFLNIEANLGGFKADLKLIEIQELQIQTKAPYVQVKNAVMAFSCPQHYFSGFPITITNVKPDISGSSAGLKFDVGVNLTDISNNMLPSAVTTLKIGANIMPGERSVWQRTEIVPQKVVVSGSIAGIVKIEEGTLEFFKSDPILGDGVSGTLKASFAGLDGVSIETNVKFGNTTFNYWYFDASANFPPIPVAAIFSINGFGGGAYYNMVKDPLNENMTPQEYFKNMGKYRMDAYTPKSGTLGFKAKVSFCSSDGFLFSGFAELGMTFNTTGKISINAIEGTLYAQLLNASSGGGVNENAPIKGQIDLHIGIADKVFSMNGLIGIDVANILTGGGRFAILADVANDNYYIKLGQPEEANRIKVSLANIFTLSAYFMAGNAIDASIPDPDPVIVNVAELKGYEKVKMKPDAGGLVFGANFKMDVDLRFLIFYVKASAGIGFDISLARYTEGCGGSDKPPGMDGWYATGQVYAGFTGEFGLYVDMFFFTGKVKALELGASVLLKGGLPNPYWFEGYAMMKYDVLDGSIKGEINFKVSIGDKCVPPKQIFTQPLIEELKPSDQTNNVPLNAYVEATFNYPVEKEFKIITTNDAGEDITKTFKILIKNCKVTNSKTEQLFANYFESNSYAAFSDADNKNLSMSPDNALDPQTHYSFNVSVTAQERVNNKWEDSKWKGKVVEETKEVAFKTGECKLDEFITSNSSRIGAYPFPNQRYFLQGDSKQGAIILDRIYSCAASGSPQKYDLLVKFTAFKNRAIVGTFEKPVVLNGSKYLKFDIPSLPNECIVRVEVIKRVKMTAKDNYLLYKSNTSMLTQLNRETGRQFSATPVINQGKYNQALKQSLTISDNSNMSRIAQTLHLKEKTLDILLYKYHFRTSRYNTLREKLNGMYFNNVIGYFLDAPTTELKAVENFDVFDAQGYVSETYKNGNEMFFTLPLALFKESANYNRWLKDYALPCVYQPFLSAGFTLRQVRQKAGLSFKQLQQEGDACSLNGVYCVPLRPIEISGFAPALNKKEIDAEDPELKKWDSDKLMKKNIGAQTLQNKL